MARCWIRSLAFTALVTFIFAGLTTLRVGDGVSAKARGAAVIGNILHSSFVEPFGLPLTLLGVAVLTLAYCGFFALGQIEPQPSVEPTGFEAEMAGKFVFPAGPDPIGSMAAKNDFDRQSRAGASAFGRKQAVGTAAGTAPLAKPARLTDPAQIVLHVLKENGLDWYMAHQGYEGNWRQAHAGLLALGHRRQAEILCQAGACYDRYIRDVFTPADGEPSQEDDQAYSDQMHKLDREWRAANPLSAHS